MSALAGDQDQLSEVHDLHQNQVGRGELQLHQSVYIKACHQPDRSLSDGGKLHASTGTQTSCTYARRPGKRVCMYRHVDTSTQGLHTFTVTAIDSGGNTNVNAVVYNVK